MFRADGAAAVLSRRRVLVGTVLALGGAASARGQAAVDPMAMLGRSWSLPPQGSVEIDTRPLGADLAAVLAAIAGWTVPPGARLVLRLPPGEHAQPAPVVWRHPDGERIGVLGTAGDAARCRLIWRDGGDGVYVGAGQLLGELAGVTLVQTGAGGQGSGLLADEGGALRCGGAVAIEGFYYCVQARRNGTARCAGVRCAGGGDANFFAFMGGHVYARGALAVGARDDARRLGSGFVAEYGGSIDAEGAQAQLNALDGFTALSNGVIRAYRARAERNGRAGFFADTGGRIVGHDAVAAANCGSGVTSRDGGRAITGERLAEAGNHAPAETCQRR